MADAGTPPGWYDDPWRAAPLRWWDGQAWTPHTHPPPGSAVQPFGAQPLRPTIQYTAAGRALAAEAALPRARDDITGGGIAVLGFAGAMSLALLSGFVLGTLGLSKQSIVTTVVSQTGLWTGLFMAAYIVTHRRAGGSLQDLGLRVPTGREIARGIGIAIGAIVVESRVIVLLRTLLPPDNRSLPSNVFVQHRPSGVTFAITALIVCVGAPFFEELFFRGIVQAVLRRRVGPGPAIVLQALLFGSAHYQLGMTANQALVRIVGISIVGFFLGYLRESTGRLGAGMVAHATNNFIVVLIAYFVIYH